MPDDTDKQLVSQTHIDIGELWASESDASDSKEETNTDTNKSVGDIKMELPEDGASEVVGDVWITSTSDIGGANASRVPFTKREKEFLCSLIQKHVYAKIGPSCPLPTLSSFNSKSALSTFCRVPNAAWKTIETEFNNKDNVRPRSIKQLRKCWENLKHRGNINPAALYSGKKLHARTSLSGAFTLTTDGEEEGSKLTPPKSSEAFVETSLTENDSTRMIENASSLTTTKSKDIFSNITPIRASVGTNGSAPFDELTENMFQSRNTVNHTTAEQMASSAMSAAQLIASFSRTATTSSPFNMTSRPAMASPRITNVRTVRSLKPAHNPPQRKKFSIESRIRPNGTRPFSTFSMVAKTHTQKIHEMKVKLMNTRIKEHEVNIQKVNMQMQQAQAHHDVTMRLLRTKAAFFDVHLRQLEKQLDAGDMSMVGEENEEYGNGSFSEMDLQYEDEY